MTWIVSDYFDVIIRYYVHRRNIITLGTSENPLLFIYGRGQNWNTPLIVPNRGMLYGILRQSANLLGRKTGIFRFDRSLMLSWSSILQDTLFTDVSVNTVYICTEAISDIGFAGITLVQHGMSDNTHY